MPLALVAIVALLAAACGGGNGETPSSPAPATTLTPTATADPATSPPRTLTPTPSATPEPTLTSPVSTPTVHPGPSELPLGFPIDPALKLGLVTGTPRDRTVLWGAGPAAEVYARNDQPSEDPERANRSGWNCRVHLAYEGLAAVDWYIPVGTPVTATMDGTATLYVITVTNAFDQYGVDREPYLGNPDRTRAPLSPFPGPSGGKGTFVRIENAEFVTDYAHLDLTQSVPLVPIDAFLPGYGPDSDYVALFSPVRDFSVSTAIAQWPVKRGDPIGLSGDSGYSEAPHLHYTIGRRGTTPLLCPTQEAGFQDGGWLLR